MSAKGIGRAKKRSKLRRKRRSGDRRGSASERDRINYGHIHRRRGRQTDRHTDIIRYPLRIVAGSSRTRWSDRPMVRPIVNRSNQWFDLGRWSCGQRKFRRPMAVYSIAAISNQSIENYKADQLLQQLLSLCGTLDGFCKKPRHS